MAERPKGEDVKRVRSVVDEAIELIAANAQGPAEIQAGSDSFNVRIALKYTGNLPALPDARSWSKSKASSAGSLDISPGCMPTGSSAVREAKRVKLSSFSGCESY
ncbi:MAG: hypothetical protein WBV90_12465 [Terrimicrobiaceae bacterium]